MKLVTNDYGCGTSSSILDYEIEDVIVVSQNNWKHIFDSGDDLLFIGHDFLMYMWDSPEKIELLKSYPHSKTVWCFERIDAFIPLWQRKSHYSLSCIKQFADEILACDEDDCDTYGYKWLPQWASRKFYDLKYIKPNKPGLLFSGQAGKPEYAIRNKLIAEIYGDKELKEIIQITNIQRDLSWNEYIVNLLSYSAVLNPFGVLRALNTRAYEVLYSGRMLFQHKIGEYSRHESMLSGYENAVFFENLEELREKLENIKLIEDTSNIFMKNNIFARMKSIGVDLK